jgi:hypothetical protein
MLAVRKGNRAPTSQHRAEWLLRPSYSTTLMNEREILLRTVTVHSAAHRAARRGLSCERQFVKFTSGLVCVEDREESFHTYQIS